MSIDRTKYMDAREVHILRESAQSKGGLTWMVVDMALMTGLRVSELTQIKVSDIDFEREFVWVTRLKKKEKKREALDLDKRTLEHLREYTKGKNGALFIGQRGALTYQGLQKIWKAAIKKAGLPKEYSIHTARNTLGMHLTTNNNISYAQYRLGHVNPATTAKYYGGIISEDMKQALNGLY